MKKHVCRKCAGKGYVEKQSYTHHEDVRDYKVLCLFCHGQGKMDWVGNVTGSKEITNPMYLINQELSLKHGNYKFKLDVGNEFFVKEEFGILDKFEDKWKFVIINMKSLDPDNDQQMVAIRATDEPPNF